MNENALPDHHKQAIQNCLRSFDPRNTGHVKSQNVGNILRSLKLIPTNEEISRRTEELDPHHTGFIATEDLYHVIAKMWPSSEAVFKRQIWNAFLLFDKEDRGKLSSQTLHKILTTYGKEPLTEAEVKKIIKDNADPQDGEIEYGSLIRQWMK
ncbi:Myosin regulatory light chain [Clonorchis sinensis]|uniref:Troponin C skeletal muscle n=2 Tax=Clonorchis sinensis TaxID=79923 RepID=H2KQ17_CLOSI|nr:Myosin regulatory light chain [Clonorchis sinensis]GAA40081.1 troponin C skeletal muscle [Clonorchis sinensis]